MKPSFFTDKTGKVVVWQAPSLALVLWVGLSLANLVVHSPKLGWLGTAFLFTWAWLELTAGVNYFRQLLGLIVLLGLLTWQLR